MTDGEQKTLVRGLAAGILIGMTIGLVIALFVVMRPHGHNWAAVVIVSIATFTAVVVPLWAAFSRQTSPNDGPKGPKRR
jgi:hypothetical protein